MRLKNWEPLPISADQIHCVILTHAHIDHSGYIPRLVKEGFRGKVYCTPATKELCEVLLPDTGFLLEEEAGYLTKKGKSKHKQAMPLFNLEEAKVALNHFESVDFDQNFQINESLSFRFHYAGHILGAASVILNVSGKFIGFSGDVGRLNDEILFAPSPLPKLDFLVVESTYGNRLHPKEDIATQLANVINETFQRKGVLMIPAFTVGRCQTLMYYLWKLREQNRIPRIPTFLNSPMATNVNEIFTRYHKLHRLSREESRAVCDTVTYVRSTEESIRLNERKDPMIIISASGMLTGGRILHHLKAFGPEAKNTILLTGFQAAGTRGASLMSGADELKIHGQYIPIRAEVKILDNLSAHADRGEILDWLERSKLSPYKVFITHGEASASDELRRRIEEKFGWNCQIPEQGEVFNFSERS